MIQRDLAKIAHDALNLTRRLAPGPENEAARPRLQTPPVVQAIKPLLFKCLKVTRQVRPPSNRINGDIVIAYLSNAHIGLPKCPKLKPQTINRPFDRDRSGR